MDFKTVQRLGRWKTLNVLLDLYARSFPDDQRSAVERLPFFGQRMGNGEQADGKKRKAG